METHILHGVTCEYTIRETNQTLFIGDAAKKGLVAIFPEAAFEEKKKKYRSYKEDGMPRKNYINILRCLETLIEFVKGPCKEN